VISSLARDPGLVITVSPSIPVAQWRQHPVTLRMANVTRRAFLDWLVRPLRAEYAIEADGGAWLTRGDDLLLREPLVARGYRVATHIRSRSPVRGALVYAAEQKAILRTLDDCLRYLESRRPECRLTFHGEQDVLAANLPPRGHKRLEATLYAMRYGSELPKLPRPTTGELQAKLKSTLACDWPPGPINQVLALVAEQAGVNLGWDATRLGSPTVAIPRGKHTLKEVLDTVVRQTRLGRHQVEPGHGIWLYREGEDADFPPTGATPWDRASVRAYEIGVLLAHRRPEEVLKELRRQVDPGQWKRGLPAASVFAPTSRLIVVHDEDGHRRARAVVQAMLQDARRPVEPSKKKKKQ